MFFISNESVIYLTTEDLGGYYLVYTVATYLIPKIGNSGASIQSRLSFLHCLTSYFFLSQATIWGGTMAW